MLDLTALRDVDIKTVDRASLVDLRDVRIDESLPQPQRLLQLFRQIRNPYCYKCGELVIKESFSNNGKSMGDCLKQYIATLV